MRKGGFVRENSLEILFFLLRVNGLFLTCMKICFVRWVAKLEGGFRGFNLVLVYFGVRGLDAFILFFVVIKKNNKNFVKVY